MSLICAHGFEESTTGTDYGTTTGAGIAFVGGARTGSQCLSLGNSTITFSCATAEERDTFIVGFASNSTGGKKEIRFLSDSQATQHVTINLNADGSIDARRGATGGTLLGSATSAGTYALNTWVFIEAKVKLHDTTGTVDVRVNGASVLSLTGQDTKNGGTKTVLDSVALTGPSTTTHLFDDFYWCNDLGSVNNGFLGDKKVVTLFPNGDGNSTQFTPSTGSTHYTLVDEAPRNTTDYNSTSTSGHVDLYTYDNLPAGSQNVSAIQIELYAAKSDAGATCYFQRAVRSASNNYFGDAIALSTGFTYLKSGGARVILESDPATSSAWATSAVDAIEAGARFDI